MIRPWSVELAAEQVAPSVGSLEGRRLAAAEAVGAHAQVAVRVDRAAAERAGGAAGADDLRGALHERPRGAGGEPDQEDLLGLGLLEVLADLLGRDDGRLGEREDLDDDPLVAGVPGERHRAGPELLLDRLLERLGVVEAERRDRRDDRGLPSVVHQLVEQLVDALGEHRHLLLLQRDADHARATAGLQEERALPGRADGAGDEALGRVEAVDDRHVVHPRTPSQSRRTGRRRRPRRRRWRRFAAAASGRAAAGGRGRPRGC